MTCFDFFNFLRCTCIFLKTIPDAFTTINILRKISEMLFTLVWNPCFLDELWTSDQNFRPWNVVKSVTQLTCKTKTFMLWKATPVCLIWVTLWQSLLLMYSITYHPTGPITSALFWPLFASCNNSSWASLTYVFWHTKNKKIVSSILVPVNL